MIHTARRHVLLFAAGLLATALPLHAAEPKPGSAEAAFAALVAAYEAGDLGRVDEHLDASMNGRGAFVQKARDSINTQKQIRIALADTEAIVEGEAVFMNARWEKRFLALPGMKPGLASGRLSAVMKRSGGRWKVTGLMGDNPFSAAAP